MSHFPCQFAILNIGRQNRWRRPNPALRHFFCLSEPGGWAWAHHHTAHHHTADHHTADHHTTDHPIAVHRPNAKNVLPPAAPTPSKPESAPKPPSCTAPPASDSASPSPGATASVTISSSTTASASGAF